MAKEFAIKYEIRDNRSLHRSINICACYTLLMESFPAHVTLVRLVFRVRFSMGD